MAGHSQSKLEPRWVIGNGISFLVSLIALTAYPPRNLKSDDWDRSIDRTLTQLKRWAAHGHFEAFGFDHPNNPRPGHGASFEKADKKKFKDYDNGGRPFEATCMAFKRAVDAGRAFLSVPVLDDPNIGEIKQTAFEGPANFDFFETMRDHKDLIRESGASRNKWEYNNRSKALFEHRWASIHIAAAFAQLIEFEKRRLGKDICARDLCRGLLLSTNDQPALCSDLANWANDYALRARHFPMLKTRPLIHVRYAR